MVPRVVEQGGVEEEEEEEEEEGEEEGEEEEGSERCPFTGSATAANSCHAILFPFPLHWKEGNSQHSLTTQFLNSSIFQFSFFVSFDLQFLQAFP